MFGLVGKHIFFQLKVFICCVTQHKNFKLKKNVLALSIILQLNAMLPHNLAKCSFLKWKHFNLNLRKTLYAF